SPRATSTSHPTDRPLSSFPGEIAPAGRCLALSGARWTMAAPAPGHGNGFGRPHKPEVAALTDRLPPQNLEAEQGLLGSILLDNNVLHDVVTFLNVQDFYRDSHQIIYRAICDLYDRGKAIDAITLPEELERRGEYKTVGGDETLARILESVPHSANAIYYAQIVRQKAIGRLLIESANEILREGYSNNFTAEQLLESAERMIYNIAEDKTKGDTVELKDVIREAMERIDLRAESRHAVTGVGTGYFELDDITGGFQPEQ